MPIVVLPNTLDAPVTALPKVYAPDGKRLARLGVKSIRELLLNLPFDWEAYGAPADHSHHHAAHDGWLLA